MQEVASVKSWININASPFAWQRILFKLLPEFKKEGFFFHTITDDSTLSPTLLEKISEALFDAYKLELSRDFFKNTNENLIDEIDTVANNENEEENNDDVFKNSSKDSDNFIS